MVGTKLGAEVRGGDLLRWLGMAVDVGEVVGFLEGFFVGRRDVGAAEGLLVRVGILVGLTVTGGLEGPVVGRDFVGILVANLEGILVTNIEGFEDDNGAFVGKALFVELCGILTDGRELGNFVEVV
jgi:hypothetical protein